MTERAGRVIGVPICHKGHSRGHDVLSTTKEPKKAPDGPAVSRSAPGLRCIQAPPRLRGHAVESLSGRSTLSLSISTLLILVCLRRQVRQSVGATNPRPLPPCATPPAQHAALLPDASPSAAPLIGPSPPPPWCCTRSALPSHSHSSGSTRVGELSNRGM
jgi:hypothetical protein